MGFKVYSLEGCGYSRAAIVLLDEYDVNYEVINVSQSEKEIVKRELSVRTFPQIYYNRIHIGGYDDLKMMIDCMVYLDEKGIGHCVYKGIRNDLFD